jgi:diguanylate cyclase (GGDEF)-like protein/PAS domain S-box-containing protein
VLQRAVPALLGFVVIVALGGVALRIGRSNLDAAEQDRLTSRIGTVDALSGNVADQADPSVNVPRLAATPFSPAGGPINDLLIQQFHVSDDPAAVNALITLDGRALASDPPDVALDPADFGPYWQKAAAGHPTLGDNIRYQGVLTNPTLVPVGSPNPWAVLVSLKPALGSAGQAFLEQVGSLNGLPGGLTVVDRAGNAYESWSREEIGQSVLTPAEMAALPVGSSRVWTRERDGAEWTTIGRNIGDGIGFLFEQRTDDLFGDLRAAQHQRDTTLVAVLVAALLALVVFQLSREIGARRAEARVRSLLRNGQDIVLVADPDGTLRFVSPAVESLLGHRSESWLRQDLGAVSHPDDRARVAGLLTYPESGPLLNVRFPGKDGEVRFFDVEARDLSDHPEVGGILLTCHEIGERKQLEDELSYQATHDQLTGLPNRAELGHRLDGLVRDGRPVRPFAVIYLDLDHFKPVNDTYGHDAGDEVLVTVAGRLRDAAGPTGFVSRLGGDEFAVVLDGADRGTAVAVAEALRDAARQPVAVSAHLAHLDASIGIALATPDMVVDNVEHLVRWADEAMYGAKRSGRGRWSLAAPEHTETTSGDQGSGVAGPGTVAADPGAWAPGPSTPPRAVVPGPEVTGPPDTRRRRRLAAALPIAVAVAVVVGIAGIGVHQSADAQRTAEQDLIHHQLAFAGRAANFYSSVNDAAPLVRAASAAPWTLDGGAIDETVAKAFATAPNAGADAVAVLATTDGDRLAAYPAGTPLTVEPSSPIWQDAVIRGQGNQLSRVADPDQPRTYFVLPVRKNGRTVAVLALGLSLSKGPGQVALEQAGSAGFTTGGWSMLNGEGVVYMSWNTALIGTRLIDPAQLTGMAPGTTRDLTDEQQILMVAPMTSTIDPTYIAFAMPAADFLRDLRIGQLQRDRAFVALLAAAVLGLALVNQRREQAVRRSEARLDSLLQQAHDVVTVLDDDGRATFISSAAQRLLGHEPADHLGQPLIELVHPEDRDRVATMLRDAVARGAGSATDVRIIDTGGTYHWFDTHAIDLRATAGGGGILVTCHEVTERRQLQETLVYRAQHDPLTGLPNRSTLARQLAALASTSPTAPFAVLFIDLDNFKPVNDTLGHDAGDDVLRIIAERFTASVRINGGDLVCRLGGDEFAVILPNTTDGVARATAERLIAAAREPITVGTHTVQVGASIGVSVSHPNRHSPDTAIRYADIAMYQAKQAGRGGYAVFDADRAGPETPRIQLTDHRQ